MTRTSADAAGVAEVAAAEPAGEFRGGAAADQRSGQAARPQLIRALNEQLLLGHIRQLGPCSRAELARLSGLSKPTVSLALANVERSGLIRIAGQRTGVPGRSARLYEIRPDAGFVLGLDIGHHYLRGALADLTGEIRAQHSARTRASSVRGRVAELIRLADTLCADAGSRQGRDHPDRDRQPGRLRPAAGRDGAHRRPVRPEPPGGAGRPAGRVRAGPRGRERRGRRGAGRAGARARQRVRELRVRVDRHRHRPRPGPRRQAAPRGARGGRRDRLHADLGGRRAPTSRTPAGGARSRPPDPRRPWCAPPGGRACADRSRRAASSRPRPRATSAPWRWWPPRRGWWPRRSAPWSPSSTRNSSCWAAASARPPGSRPR